jgi:hypothetical protein
MKFRMLLVGVLMSLLASATLAQVPKPWVGAWKLNIAKSTLRSGPPPISQIDTIAAVKGEMKFTSDRVGSDGKTTHVEYTGKLDGRDLPYKGYPAADTISVTKIDDYSNTWVTKKDGKPVATGGTNYSRDGKSRTLTFTSANAAGEKVETIAVFDRQKK